MLLLGRQLSLPQICHPEERAFRATMDLNLGITVTCPTAKHASILPPAFFVTLKRLAKTVKQAPIFDLAAFGLVCARP